MKLKTKLITIFALLASAKLFAANTLSLLESAKNKGMTVYWDSLSETGMIEKAGHQLSFRNGEGIVVLDSLYLQLTDAPEIANNQIMVSQKFLSDAETFFSQKTETPFKVGAILIDPGHGGKDPGALKTYKIGGKSVTIREKDINLKVGKMLYDRLKTAYPDKKIVLTRSSDLFISLGERTEIANSVKVKENEAVLFISIHVNSSLNKSSSGYEVWYLSPNYRRTVIDKSSIASDENALFPILNSMTEEEFTTESIMIAKFIMDGLQAQIGKESTARGIRAEEWFVVKNSNMPAVLVELGFVSNEKEALLMNDDKYLKKATLGIYNGLSAFITHFERSEGFTAIK
ncbi:N-acetylmuramoyl-L-alanine amidase [Treponema sp. C6A8]|uniref:N-acetylmuramoyl-L-alanine amidase n=1 Tax=Treponema sp. C6A8 TaxID=1410609 RepID=UPI0006847932|nr:N-acetylmuramoyl-L-alanine amidase [Treponema sp. C6A8]